MDEKSLLSAAFPTALHRQRAGTLNKESSEEAERKTARGAKKKVGTTPFVRAPNPLTANRGGQRPFIGGSDTSDCLSSQAECDYSETRSPRHTTLTDQGKCATIILQPTI